MMPRDQKTLPEIIDSQWNKTGNVRNCVVIAESVDALTPLDARTTAGIMMTKSEFHIYLQRVLLLI